MGGVAVDLSLGGLAAQQDSCVLSRWLQDGMA